MLVEFPSEEAKKEFREKALKILICYSSLEEYYGVPLLPWEIEIVNSISKEDIKNHEIKLREEYGNRIFS